MTESTIDAIISRVTARAVSIPLEYPVRTSVGTITIAPLVLIDLETSEGITGHSYLFAYTPLVLRATRELVQDLGEVLVGQHLAPIMLEAFLAQRLRLLGRTGLALMACSGLDMAAWDAVAVHRRLPLVELLGGIRRPIPAYDSHTMDGEVIGVERALRARVEGYKAIKTKVGYATLAEDLHIVRALRAAVGPDIEIMVDYNQGLRVPEALRRIASLQQEGVSWVEEPTLQEDWKGHAWIRDHVDVPIQMGENWCGLEEMTKALDVGACDLAMPDVMKIGGVTGWLRAAALAQARNMPMSSHIMQEVSAHLLGVTPTAHWLERLDFAAPILQQPLRFENGCALLADKPGTGVDWNEEAVALYAVY